jgi:hypothetical protein
MTAESVARVMEEFLGGSRNAVVVEDGAQIFDLNESKYSISGEYHKCVLHLWSAERNVVRRILDSEVRNGNLRLMVQKLGQSRPSKLEICKGHEHRTPTARRAARATYQQHLRRTLERHFPDFTLTKLSNAMDLKRSFGPIYARGILRRGRTAFAVLGVNEQETHSSIDAALTFAILWLDACRNSEDPRVLVEGLKLFLPTRTAALTCERMAHLNAGAAKWQVYECDERHDELTEIDFADRGNVATRLVRCPDEAAVLDRFAESIHRILSLLPETEVAVISTAEVAFRWRGLEFARARLAHQPGTFRTGQEIAFGIGAEERMLEERSSADFAVLVQKLRVTRGPQGARHQPLWRLHPERWLESLVLHDVRALDERLDGGGLYSQVPAFTASDRAMLDVLTTTHDHRLAVVELKADEDIHLPLQGLDYWSRVEWHHARGEFTQFGYFPGRELSPEDPLLLLVAPTLHIHPATDTVLRYVNSRIDWTLVGIDERWREGVRVIFRKRQMSRLGADSPDNISVAERRAQECTRHTSLPRLPVSDAGSRVDPGDTRCDQRPALFRAGRSGRQPPRAAVRINRFSGWPPAPEWLSDPCGTQLRSLSRPASWVVLRY